MEGNEAINGEIIGIRDLGCGFIIFLDNGDGRVLPITLDCQAVWELRACGQIAWADLIGRRLLFDGGQATLLSNGASQSSLN